jgi:hypothetical protein
MSIFITGDMHGYIDISKFKADNIKTLNHEFSRNDFMIITGDFGLLWSNSPKNPTEKKLREWLDAKPWTTLFIDGNHENFARLKTLPEVEMFGNKVGKYTDHIFHLKRGHHYIIDGTSFFVMGGGVSVDKAFRIPHISWWEEEMPNYEEYAIALETLERINYKVDVILTHTAPEHIRAEIMRELILPSPLREKIIFKDRDQLSMFLESLITDHNIQFKQWFFAHYHIDKDFENRYYCSYNRILKLEGNGG